MRLLNLWPRCRPYARRKFWKRWRRPIRIKAPSTLNHRYISEDVPVSLVPIAALGQHYGFSVRGMDAIISGRISMMFRPSAAH